jgi:hypothetical protein
MSRDRGACWCLSLAVLISVGACPGETGRTTAGPRLEVRWKGTDSATVRTTATASWCDSLNLLEIVALAGDTGIAIAIYPRDGIATGAYPVRLPAAADSAPPSSALALRWFSQTAVRGFQSDSGALSLTRESNGTLSGQFRAVAHPVNGKGTMRLTGSFSDLRERPATRGCSTAPQPEPKRPDSSSGLD